MLKATFNLAIVAASIAALPLAAAAQQPVQQQLPAEAQQLMAEAQEIQTQIQPVQMQALQDPALQQQQQQLSGVIDSALTEVDPTVPQKMARLQELQGEAAAAQQAEDMDAVRAAVIEAQEIQTAIGEAQQQVLQQPAIEQRVDQFQTALRAKMVEIDPDTEPLLQRLSEIDDQLSEMFAQAAG